MDCTEIRNRMPEAAEGELPPGVMRQVERHLDECPDCRGQYQQVCRATDALRGSLTRLAPRERYLTTARRERLMRAREGRDGGKIITLKRMVAAAAAAAIIAALPFVWSDISRLLDQPQPQVARQVSQSGYVPVVLAAPGHDEPLRMIPRLSAAGEGDARSERRSTDRGELLPSDTPKLRAPVQNALYDPEESSHWW
ncbi:MAG: anti-sigma factor family protein [Planctomycetota bacterium]